MGPVRVVRAFRLSMMATMTGLALSGCMGRSGPVAMVQPQSDLDALAYSRPVLSQAGHQPSAAYAAASPVAYDQQYRLDAGDKLRVVVYGQEGLTNSYAID